MKKAVRILTVFICMCSFALNGFLVIRGDVDKVLVKVGLKERTLETD